MSVFLQHCKSAKVNGSASMAQQTLQNSILFITGTWGKVKYVKVAQEAYLINRGSARGF